MTDIQRGIYNDILNHLNKKEISLIVGPRQVGKTTLMKKIKKYLDDLGERTIYLNLDYEGDSSYFESQDKLLDKLRLEFGKGKGYVFIDEIQKKENAGIFLKGIYDRDLNHKFIISGSGSLELKEKIHESLAGRKRVFELSPVTFFEFVNYKTDYIYTNRLNDFFRLEKEKTNNYLIEYLNFGGYPRVILEDQALEKKIIIDEIYKSYILKDVGYLLKVEKMDAFNMLLKILSSQIGQIVKYSELAKQVGISEQTIKNYLYYAENTFAIKILSPFFKNKQKEITKSPVIYFNDLGLKNYIIGTMGTLQDAYSLGFIFQNFIYNLFITKFIYTNKQIKFWRTIDKTEVDFVIEDGMELLPVEIKYSNLKKPEITKSLRSFIDKYNPKEVWVINLSLTDEMILGGTKIYFKPFYHLI